MNLQEHNYNFSFDCSLCEPCLLVNCIHSDSCGTDGSNYV